MNSNTVSRQESSIQQESFLANKGVIVKENKEDFWVMLGLIYIRATRLTP